MISLCLNLAKEIGFRPTETALNIVFDWLGIKAKVPSFDSIRVWSCRVGIAQLKLLVRDDEAWIWLADHSNQIGQEKVLQIIGIRVKDLPPIGETLPRDKMMVLATVPGTSWTRDDVRREYRKLAERLGPPAYLVTDGAVELIESADALKMEGKTPIVLQASLGFINRHGVYHGAAAKLKIELAALQSTHPPDCDLIACELSTTMVAKLLAFVEESESKLPEGDRAWLSTENLESLFGQYKRLEGQHSKGGFTSLIAALPMLLTHWTPDKVRASLTAVPVKAVQAWVQENLTTTLTSKRSTAYKEFATNSG